MDLRKFYFEQVSEDEYYYKFYDLIQNVNAIYNIFEGYQEVYNYEFILFDLEEVVEKFKYLCLPENENHSQEDRCWFYLCLFYLFKSGYYIQEFPRLIERPPVDSYDFVNKEIRNKLLLDGKDENGNIPYAERRRLIANLHFNQKASYISVNEVIERKFKEISTRQASFIEMTKDEKICEIANLIENFLKKGDKYISIDYSKIAFDYITEEDIKSYRHKMQCFRHSSEKAIIERQSYSEGQKDFLIDYGLTILKLIHALVE